MLAVRKPKLLQFTYHSRAKMRYWGLSESRVKHAMHSPRRVEEGIAPKTIAMMQPITVKREQGRETWKQELWVMIQDMGSRRKIISAWRYPGMTKPRDEITKDFLRQEYRAYTARQ